MHELDLRCVPGLSKDLRHKVEVNTKGCVAVAGVGDPVHAALASVRACNT